MTISVGDRVPSTTLRHMTSEGSAEISTDELFGGKTVALFALPGAFTPTCSAKHVPSYVAAADALKAKGVDTIVCLSVNDAFVMGAWGEDRGVGDKVMMVADGSAKFGTAAGLDSDMSAKGFGVRSQRFSMVVDDGTVTSLQIDAPGTFENTSAEVMLGAL